MTRDACPFERARDRLMPLDQTRLQRTLEQTLFTWCDDMKPGERGLHWSFDWLLAPRETFALAVGRFFEPTHAYCYVALKHQSNQQDTRGTGVVYELRLPVDTFRFDPGEGRFTLEYEGGVHYRVQRLVEPTASLPSGVDSPDGHIEITLHKELWRPWRPWCSDGEVRLFERQGGPLVCSWSWSYEVAEVVDRPDYDAKCLLGVLRSGRIPSGNGHFIPAMRADLTGESVVSFREGDAPEISHDVQAAYLDGNFGRASNRQQIITDRWAWMAAPQLWSVDGEPVDHMMTFGFFQQAMLPLQPPDTWTGAILWRSDADDMNRFTAMSLLDRIDVHFHSPRYLDVTFVTQDRSYRITLRAWSHTLTTPMTTPMGEPFQDHQDLLADAYVVIEQNLVAPWQRLWCRPRWEQTARLVTNTFGFEFGEQERVIGTPGYPAYAAVPQMPDWLIRSLRKLEDAPLGHPRPSPRLDPINH